MALEPMPMIYWRIHNLWTASSVACVSFTPSRAPTTACEARYNMAVDTDVLAARFRVPMARRLFQRVARSDQPSANWINLKCSRWSRVRGLGTHLLRRIRGLAPPARVSCLSRPRIQNKEPQVRSWKRRSRGSCRVQVAQLDHHWKHAQREGYGLERGHVLLPPGSCALPKDPVRPRRAALAPRSIIGRVLPSNLRASHTSRRFNRRIQPGYRGGAPCHGCGLTLPIWTPPQRQEIDR